MPLAAFLGHSSTKLTRPGLLKARLKLQALVYDILPLEEGAGKRCSECGPDFHPLLSSNEGFQAVMFQRRWCRSVWTPNQTSRDLSSTARPKWRPRSRQNCTYIEPRACDVVCGFTSVTEEMRLPVNVALFSPADRSAVCMTMCGCRGVQIQEIMNCSVGWTMILREGL